MPGASWPAFARHGLNLCQVRGPECVEESQAGLLHALQLRNTRVLLTKCLSYPFEGPSERAKLEQELEGVAHFPLLHWHFGDLSLSALLAHR